MGIKDLLLEHYGRRNDQLCFNCCAGVYLKSAYFIGMPVSMTCTHDRDIKYITKPSVSKMISSLLFGIVTFARAIFRFSSSYNGDVRFWDVENLTVMGELFFGLAQSLVVLCLTRNFRTLASLADALQRNLFKLKSIASEKEILDMLYVSRCELNVYIIVNVCLCIVFVAYQTSSEGYLDIDGLLTTYCGFQTTIGLGLLISFHRRMLEISYAKLRDVLAFANGDQNFYRLTDVLLAGTRLDTFIDFRLSCYQSFYKVNRFINFGLYVYLFFNVLAYYMAALISSVQILEGTTFTSTDKSFVVLAVLYLLIATYVCRLAQGLLDLNDSILVFLSTCRTRSLADKDSYKLDAFVEIVRCQTFEVRCSGSIVLSSRFFINVVYMFTTYTLVGLQFYLDKSDARTN